MYLPVKQLAQRWHFRSPKRLYALKEEIGYTKISGKLLFPIQQVEAYERQHTVLPKSGEAMPTTEETTQQSKHCIYCQKPMQAGEELYWGLDDIEVCGECYNRLQAIKVDRIEAYKKYYGKKGRAGRSQ